MPALSARKASRQFQRQSKSPSLPKLRRKGAHPRPPKAQCGEKSWFQQISTSYNIEGRKTHRTKGFRTAKISAREITHGPSAILIRIYPRHENGSKSIPRPETPNTPKSQPDRKPFNSKGVCQRDFATHKHRGGRFRSPMIKHSDSSSLHV